MSSVTLPRLIIVPAQQFAASRTDSEKKEDLYAPLRKYVRRLQNWFRAADSDRFEYYLPTHLHEAFCTAYMQQLEKNGYKIALAPDRVEVFF